MCISQSRVFNPHNCIDYGGIDKSTLRWINSENEREKKGDFIDNTDET